MQDHKGPHHTRKRPDGFATLSATMMERAGPASQVPEMQHAKPGTPTVARLRSGPPPAAFGKLNREPPRQPYRGEKAQKRPVPGENLADLRAEADQKSYRGPERRHREVSPVVERRRAMPTRIRVSVRLEHHRHSRLKNTAVLLERTHQDLMTSALDFYLDVLGVPLTKSPIFDIKQ